MSEEEEIRRHLEEDRLELQTVKFADRLLGARDTIYSLFSQGVCQGVLADFWEKLPPARHQIIMRDALRIVQADPKTHNYTKLELIEEIVNYLWDYCEAANVGRGGQKPTSLLKRVLFKAASQAKAGNKLKEVQ